jgi:hypothetical protein
MKNLFICIDKQQAVNKNKMSRVARSMFIVESLVKDLRYMKSMIRITDKYEIARCDPRISDFISPKKMINHLNTIDENIFGLSELVTIMENVSGYFTRSLLVTILELCSTNKLKRLYDTISEESYYNFKRDRKLIDNLDYNIDILESILDNKRRQG